MCKTPYSNRIYFLLFLLLIGFKNPPLISRQPIGDQKSTKPRQPGRDLGYILQIYFHKSALIYVTLQFMAWLWREDVYTPNANKTNS